MIYQETDKLRVMKCSGLTWKEVNLPYPQWSALRRQHKDCCSMYGYFEIEDNQGGFVFRLG